MMEVSSGRPRADADSPVQLMSSTQEPIHIAFLGCGFITRVHSRHIRRLGGLIVPAYASRDRATAEAMQARQADRIGFDDACGARSIAGLLTVAAQRGLRIAIADLRHSGDTAGPAAQVVGYGAFHVLAG